MTFLQLTNYTNVRIRELRIYECIQLIYQYELQQIQPFFSNSFVCLHKRKENDDRQIENYSALQFNL